MRRLTLGGWLALGAVVTVLVPALGAFAAWWAMDAHQHADIDRRAARAAALIGDSATGSLDRSLARGLAALDVEAELKGTVIVDAKNPDEAKLAALKAKTTMQPRPDMTEGLQLTLAQKGKDALQTEYVQREAPGGIVFIHRPGIAPRVAAAGITALVLLVLLLTAGSVLLRRWVVRPLARMARDIEQVAGGDIAISPVDTRAREVADINVALNGMADGLRAALEERDAAEEQRRFLVTSIAHDLRTPLFTLRGSLEAIEQGIGNADHLARARAKATLLDGLVDDLFSYSRLEYAGAELIRERVDAAAVAREAAAAVDARIVVAAPARDLVVDADRGALRRVLINLLDNAMRHAASHVELEVIPSADGVRFVVTDDGPGIAADDLAHLFEPHFRADRTRNSATGGAGLGLAIVDRLVTAQGASVTAGNAPDGGAQFTVRYPPA